MAIAQPLVISRALGRVVVTVHGPLGEEKAQRLGELLVDLVDGQGNLDLAIDLRDVGAVDAAGVAELVAAQHRLQRRGGKLVLACVAEEVRPGLCSSGLVIDHDQPPDRRRQARECRLAQ